jgi:hypothetical protein
MEMCLGNGFAGQKQRAALTTRCSRRCYQAANPTLSPALKSDARRVCSRRTRNAAKRNR